MEECVICASEYSQNEYITFDCSHQVCLVCYERLLQENKPCPFCRARIDLFIDTQTDETHSINIHSEDSNQYCRECVGSCCKCFIPLLMIPTLYYLLHYV
jgi:hypothetical protein